MTEQKNDFGVGSVEQNIIRMAVPMTVAQILNLLYNLVDRMYTPLMNTGWTKAVTSSSAMRRSCPSDRI